MNNILSVFVILSLALAVVSQSYPTIQVTEGPGNTQKIDQNVPDAFQTIGNKLYYIEERQPLNWHEAGKKCQDMGSHLASIQNESEYQLLKAKLNVNRNYWIDLNDLKKEGEFLSQTTGLKAPYLNWYPRWNPDNNKGNENCVFLWNKDKKLGMNDGRCNAILYFICEKF